MLLIRDFLYSIIMCPCFRFSPSSALYFSRYVLSVLLTVRIISFLRPSLVIQFRIQILFALLLLRDDQFFVEIFSFHKYSERQQTGLLYINDLKNWMKNRNNNYKIKYYQPCIYISMFSTVPTPPSDKNL